MSSLFLVRVPSDLNTATVDDYENQYDNLWPMTSSNDIMNVSVDGTQITLFVYLENFENITAIYDLNTGWAKSIYSILFMTMNNQTSVFHELKLEDMNYGKTSTITNVPFSEISFLSLPVFIIIRKLTKRKENI